MTCGADLSDPEVSTRSRTLVKELFEAIRTAAAGRYRVIDMLGRGGMGAVFLAEDLRLGRTVAIKVLRPELANEPSFVGRFEREARISASLDHANIIPIYSVEEVDGLHYFVMKYIAGKSLDELLTGVPLPVEQVRQILWQAACGLGHAHTRGVIHRDIKPSNLMIDETGRVIVTDFGISKALQSDTQYTSTGQMLGTPRYISPEQAQGFPLDARSDQYSLAVVGYQALVGRLPLVAETVHGLMYKHIYEMPPRADEARPGIPAAIAVVIHRALSKKTDDRFPTMEQFATALWPERPVQPGQPAPVVPGLIPLSELLARRRPALRRWAPVVGAVAAVALMAVLVLDRYPRNVSRPGAREGSQTAESAARPVTSPPPIAPAAPDTTRAQSPDTLKPDTAVREAAAARPKPPPARASRPKPRPPAPPHPGVTSPQASTPVAAGFVTINAVPYGAVAIDGIEMGDTPIVRRELPPGEHEVRITRPGFRSEVIKVTVTVGNEIRLSRSLIRDSP
jgi:serine/threonine protein kinase